KKTGVYTKHPRYLRNPTLTYKIGRAELCATDLRPSKSPHLSGDNARLKRNLCAYQLIVEG
ncbi:MAG: hypothetical protein AAGH48_06110, partial [Pseudomonadota bacterium]